MISLRTCITLWGLLILANLTYSQEATVQEENVAARNDIFVGVGNGVRDNNQQGFLQFPESYVTQGCNCTSNARLLRWGTRTVIRFRQKNATSFLEAVSGRIERSDVYWQVEIQLWIEFEFNWSCNINGETITGSGTATTRSTSTKPWVKVAQITTRSAGLLTRTLVWETAFDTVAKRQAYAQEFYEETFDEAINGRGGSKKYIRQLMQEACEDN